MEDNLKTKAAKGILWKFLDQGGTQLIQFVTGIYIARILSPEDYGLIGMMAIFLGISQVFIDSGFRSTLIQKGDQITEDDYNVVFYFNMVVSLFFYFLIFFGAPFISDFYSEPRLLLIARILGLNLVIMSFGFIQQTIFQKRINFKTLTKINLISILISVASGVVLAVLGYGVWALVSMFLSENIMKSALLWTISKWRPNLSFNSKAFRALFSTGSKLLLAGILGQLSLNVYSMVIGKYFTTNQVGYYSQGRKLQQRIGDFIIYSIQGVLFPVQSLMRDDIPRLKNAVRTNVKVTAAIALPAIIGLVAIAEPFVQIALTEKWLPSVNFIYILSIAGLFFVVSGSIGSYVLPLGKIDFYLKFQIFSNSLLMVLIVVGIFFRVNLLLLVSGKIIQEFIILVVTIYYSNIFIQYKFKEIILDITPSVLISMVMGGAVYLIGINLEVGIIILALQVFSGIFLFVLLNYIFNHKLYCELQNFVTSFIKSKMKV